MNVDAGILCCVIGIIASIGSIISNLTRDGYVGRVKIKDTEIVIEKKDLQELHRVRKAFREEKEEIHKEREEFRKEIDRLKEVIKEVEKKLNGRKRK